MPVAIVAVPSRKRSFTPYAMPEFPKFVPTVHHDPYPAIDPARTDLRGKVVVLTGGGSGIGLATARAFAQAHVKALVILDRDQDTLFDIQDGLRKEFSPQSQIHGFVANIDDLELIDKIFDKVQKDIGRVDVLVSNAAYGATPKNFATISTLEWFKAWETNVRSSYNLASAFIRQAQPGGVLIQLTSVLSHYRADSGEINGQSAYSGAKFGFARSLEVFQSERPDLRIVNIHPGLVKTAMSALNDGHEVSHDHRKCPLPHILNYLVLMFEHDSDAFLCSEPTRSNHRLADWSRRAVPGW